MAEFCYLSPDEIRKRTMGNVQVVVWGTGQTATEVAWTLDFMKIPVYAYADSDAGNCGKRIDGKNILDLEQVRKLDHPFVLIGSFAVRPIYEKLKSAGIENIAAPLEVIKIPPEEAARDLAEQNDLSADGPGEDDTLIEMYGNIGDVVLKLGMLKALLLYFGRDKVTVLAETRENAEMLRLYTEKVEVLDKGKFYADEAYRRKRLGEINSGHYRRTIVLCDARLYSNRRLLNCWNCNIREVNLNLTVPQDELLWQLDAMMLHDRFRISMKDMEPLRAELGERISAKAFKPAVRGKYICIHMGATRRERHYDPVRFSKVVDHIVQRGYQCVFIGQGEYDDFFVRTILENCDKDSLDGIVSFVGSLSLIKSFAVIAGAEIFLGTDSGMWNASYVLGKPSIVLYGGGEYGNFKHDMPWITYLTTADRSCFGCRWFCTNQGPGKYSKCMDGISEEEIMDAVDRRVSALEQERISKENGRIRI